MKKIFFLLSFFFLSLNVNANNVEDNSIIEALSEENENISLEANFELQNFNSCNDFEDEMNSYIKNYWENNKWNYYYPMRWWIVNDMVVTNQSMESSKDDVLWSSPESFSNTDNFSETNNQIEWVQESDIVKTDWKNIYYYNKSDNYVYIVGVDEQKILKKIKVPSTFSSPVLYLWNDTLTIVSSGYSNSDFSRMWYWINRDMKTFVITYDISDIENLKLDKLYIADWNYSESRKIWDLIYITSTVNFNIPYYSFESREDIDFDLSKSMPKKIDLSRSETDSNFELNWKKYPYSLNAWWIADCSDISYAFPDEETQEQYDFSPSYNIISVIDTNDTSKEVKTNVIIWNNSEIFMSQDNLYMTSNIYQNNRFTCPKGMACIMPYFPRWNNTLIHKLNISWDSLDYQDSTIVPWSPLTQYSMDENDGDFRILTKTSSWSNMWGQSYTDLYILDESLELKWSLEKLAIWEEFKSSRYIWDKLFLVTFEQIDPLFVIDVADSSNPEVLWELKMPWYSTYLHPYDENHLIWLWYDTSTNQWWWTVNSWVKVDLYEINYDKKCGDSWLSEEEIEKCESWDYKWIITKQKFTKTFGWAWSTSEALTNPRMFMWNSNEEKLFLPVNLYENSSEDIYKRTDFFAWLLTLDINKDSGIQESYKLSHIDYSWLEEERLKECSKYSTNSSKDNCYTLIDWSEYCEPVGNNYVPNYCKKDSTIWEYVASKSWNFRDSYINRALWIWDNSYAISDKKISSQKISTWENNYNVEFR